MNNEQLPADLDEGHNDLFVLFRDRVLEKENFSAGALIHTFEAMLLFAIGQVKRGNIITWDSVRAVLEYHVNSDIDGLLLYTRGQSRLYQGTWNENDIQNTRKSIEQRLRNRSNDDKPDSQ